MFIEVPQYRLISIKIAATYALAGGLWILFSDKLASTLFPDLQTFTTISIFKGWGFVGVTSLLLYIFIQRDMRLIHRSQAALKDSVARIEDEKAKSEAILAAVGDGIRILDPDYKIIYENRAVQEFMGSHIGEYCYKALTGNDTVCEGCPASISFSDGGTHMAERKSPFNRSTQYFEIKASPLKDTDGNIVAVIEVAREITARKQNESDLIRTKKLESIGILARGLSHDFNNALTGTLGNISLAKTTLRPDNTDASLLLTKAEDACLRAEGLTYQLHAVAKSSEFACENMSVAAL